MAAITPQLSGRCGRVVLRPRHRLAWRQPVAAVLLLVATVTATHPGLGQQQGAPGESRWNPAWAGGAFWSGRSWVWGWYKANPAVWDWWPASAAAWGVRGLTAPAVLSALVNEAIAGQSSQIAVPQTELRLDFGSLQAVRPMAVRFAWSAGGGIRQQAAADCQAGLLNGAPPPALAQALLLNAACHVTYGAP